MESGTVVACATVGVSSDTRCARTGEGAHIADRFIGEGSLDILFIPERVLPVHGASMPLTHDVGRRVATRVPECAPLPVIGDGLLGRQILCQS